MSYCASTCRERHDTGESVRALLSLREAVVLAGVPEREKRVRKDIETGVLGAPRILRFNDARLCVNWAFTYTLAAAYGVEPLPGKWRKLVLDKFEDFLSCNGPALIWKAGEVDSWGSLTLAECHDIKLTLDKHVYLNIGEICEEVRPRVDLYAKGLANIDEKDGTLGGEAVFKGTRLSVFHIGKMFDRGETMENILADYSYLTEEDVRFAQLYYRAHPPVGRPRDNAEAEGNRAPIAG